MNLPIAIISVLLILMIMVACPVVQADRGMISKGGTRVQLFEPNQNALAAWNGAEEILILTTDVRASEETDVLEVLPLPAEPKVTCGDVATFKRVIEMWNKYTQTRRSTYSAKGGGGAAASRPAGQITFHEQIGAHDVTVIKALDSKNFVAWVENALRQMGSKTPIVPDWIEKSIKEYI